MNAKQRKQVGQKLYNDLLAMNKSRKHMLNIDADTHNAMEEIFSDATGDQYNSADLLIHVCDRSGNLDLAACIGCFR